MAVIDFHVLVQAILYLCALVTGFVIAIPIGVNRINFQGECILYPTFDWKNSSYFTMTNGKSVNCNFPIYFSVFGLIFYGLGMGLYNFYAVIKSRTDPAIGSQMWVMPFILVNAGLAFTSFIVACMISVGFKQFCDGITQTDHFSSCFNAETRLQSMINKQTGKTFSPGPFFKLLTVAQIAGWTSVLVWVAQLIFCILRFVRNRRGRSAQMFDKAAGTTKDTSKIAELEPTA